MNFPRNTDELTARRLVLVGSFLLVMGVTAAMFAQAATGHLAAMHATDTEVAIVDYEVSNEVTLDLTLRVHNPTIKDLDFGNARMNVYVDGAQVTDGTTSSFENGGSIEPSGTEQVTVSLGLRDGSGERLQNADPEQVTVSGRIRMYVVEEPVEVPIDDLGVSE